MTPDEKDVRIAELEAQIAVKDARIAELEHKVEVLEQQVSMLLRKVEELSEQLGRNSRNSHLPPSSDGPGAAARSQRPGQRPKSGRKRGGQPGHGGARRMLIARHEVDEVVDLFPDTCSGCAAALSRSPDPTPARYQVVDLVLGGRHVKEWRRHEVVCSRCGARTRAPYDPAVIPASPFGPRLCAVVAMLTGAYHISRRQVARVFRELLAIDISVGSVSQIEARVSAALASASDEAQREVEAAAVKHTDATTFLLAGITMSLWTLASAMATVYRVFADGCRKTVQPLFGRLIGILVSDRTKVLHFWAMALRQVCWAHLLRRFVAFSQRAGPAGALGRELLDCTVLVFEYWHAFKAGQLTRDELIAWMRPVQRHVKAALERAVAADLPRMSGSCADIRAHEHALWTFVTHEGVEPTNNHAELQLRPFVLWRKRSFGCQSERGLRFAERVMTVVQTARKQGKDVLDFLVRSIMAHAVGTTPPALLGSSAPA